MFCPRRAGGNDGREGGPSHALPGDMAGRTDHAGISETGEPVRMGGRMDRMPVAISSEIAPCRKQP